MSRVPFSGFVGPSYTSQSLLAGSEVCKNWYPEILESLGAKVRMALYPCPGFQTFSSNAKTPVRGITGTPAGQCYAVGNDTLFRVLADGTRNTLGSVVYDSHPAHFATNGVTGDQLLVTSGDKGYLVTISTQALSTVINSGARHCAFLNGFFLVVDPTTGTLKCSELLNGSVWPGLYQAQRVFGADPWQAMAVIHQEVWLLGAFTGEVWYPDTTGEAQPPFLPIPVAFFEYGIAALDSLATVGDGLMWLGQDKFGGAMVLRAKGYSAERVSTHAVEFALRTAGTISDAVAWAYQEEGHLFYVLTLPTADQTWVYDVTTGMWHERGVWDVTESAWTVYRAGCHAYVFGKHLTGDNGSGAIREMSLGLYSDTGGGGGIRRQRRTPHTLKDRLWVYYSEFELDLETGLGLASGQGSDPQIMLRWSDDGGKSWGNEHWGSAGMLGQYRTRAHWHKLGRARDRVWEVTVSDPIPWRLMGAYIEAEVGTT